MPYYTPRAPQYLSRIRGMPGTSPLQWSQFNVELKQENCLLTQGPRRDSQFDVGLFQSLGSQIPGPSGAVGVARSQAWITERSKKRKDYLLPEEDEEEDDVEQCLDSLERAQRKFNRDLEEVIRAIPDLVVQVLQAERAAQPAPDRGGSDIVMNTTLPFSSFHCSEESRSTSVEVGHC
ncbi:UNVERIFIED_CONTAM: hypothetical protein K2H54_059495 [Gekko kuhli]